MRVWVTAYDIRSVTFPAALPNGWEWSHAGMTERDESSLAEPFLFNIWALTKRDGDLIIYGGAENKKNILAGGKKECDAA